MLLLRLAVTYFLHCGETVDAVLEPTTESHAKFLLLSFEPEVVEAQEGVAQ